MKREQPTDECDDRLGDIEMPATTLAALEEMDKTIADIPIKKKLVCQLIYYLYIYTDTHSKFAKSIIIHI